MWLKLRWLREKLMQINKPRNIRRARRYVRLPLSLEVLEKRLVLDAYQYVGLSNVDPTNWNDPNNWLDTTNPAKIAVPGSGDNATINGFNVVLAGGGDTIASLALFSGNLTISSSLEANTITTAAGSLFTVNGGSPPARVQVDKSASFGGFVADAGLIIANSSDVNGTSVYFAGGGATIGSGDLNGNLDAGPNSSFTFELTPAGTLLAPFTFVPGATLGPDSGSINIAAPVSINGSLDDNHMSMNLVNGGAVSGSGSTNERANFNATGGIFSVAGGMTIYGGFTSSGGGMQLNTTLTNESEFTTVGGSSFIIGPGGSLVNYSGIMKITTPTVVDSGGSTNDIENLPLGTLNIDAPGSAVNIYAPIKNTGTLNVETATQLNLNGPFGGGGPGWTDDLSGTINLSGSLYLVTTAAAYEGLTETGGSFFYIYGGTLTLPSGSGVSIQGNMEVGPTGLITGGGTVYNSGYLQLDPEGSSGTVTSGGGPVKHGTQGLGAYVMTNSAILAIEVGSGGGYTPLTVTGTADMPGTLELPGYVPVVGDSFTVVDAGGGIINPFLYIPDGMEQSETATSLTVTQVQ